MIDVNSMLIDDHLADCTCITCTRQRRAVALTERALQSIESLDDHQQTKILECGMRMRELAGHYGPYFRYAVSLTSCEIASGALILPAEAPCDQVIAHEVQKILLPAKSH